MTKSFQRVAVAALAAGLWAAAPSGRASAQSPAPGLAQVYPGETFAQGRRFRRGPSGAGIAAGVIGGLAAGALVGGLAAQAEPGPAYGGGPGAPVGNIYGQDPNYVNYCASRYRSFDPVSGTYLARDGYRYPCE